MTPIQDASIEDQEIHRMLEIQRLQEGSCRRLADVEAGGEAIGALCAAGIGYSLQAAGISTDQPDDATWTRKGRRDCRPNAAGGPGDRDDLRYNSIHPLPLPVGDAAHE